MEFSSFQRACIVDKASQQPFRLKILKIVIIILMYSDNLVSFVIGKLMLKLCCL